MSNAKLREARLLQRHKQEMASVTPANEDLQWTILRLSNLPALHHAERSQQGGNGTLYTGHGLRGYVHGGPNFLHLFRPLMLLPDLNAGQGLYLAGPLQDIPDNGISRSKVYLNLVAKLSGATAQKFPKLYLWLPACYQMEQEIAMLEEKWYPKKKMPAYKKKLAFETPWQEQGMRLFEVSYNETRVQQILLFLKENPRFGTEKEGYLSRRIIYEPIENALHQSRAPREPFLTG